MPGDKQGTQMTVGTDQSGRGFRSPDPSITGSPDDRAPGSPDGTNLVRVTFLPANRTVEFDLDRLPYAEHGKEGSLLDVALNFGIDLDHAWAAPVPVLPATLW